MAIIVIAIPHNWSVISAYKPCEWDLLQMINNYKRVTEKSKMVKGGYGRCYSVHPKWGIYKKRVEDERKLFYYPSRTS
jgi:hypothetical protein